jgi:hypothetical protein
MPGMYGRRTAWWVPLQTHHNHNHSHMMISSFSTRTDRFSPTLILTSVLWPRQTILPCALPSPPPWPLFSLKYCWPTVPLAHLGH